MKVEVLYRFESNRGEYHVWFTIEKYHVVKKTPRGYWFSVYGKIHNPNLDYPGFFKRQDIRWVSSTGKKRFAYPTKEEALVSFKARKKRQITILKAQLEFAKNSLAQIDSWVEKNRKRVYEV